MIDHNPVIEVVRGAIAGGGLWWIYSTAVRTMPPPGPLERWYGWFYSFTQATAANHDLLQK